MTDKTTVDELFPCPWCGVKGFIYHSPDGWKASCSKCNCETNPGFASETMEIAIAEWNKRTPTPPSDDLRAAMEALREGGNPTNNTIDDAYIGRMFDNCNAVLAAWDRQQGERS